MSTHFQKYEFKELTAAAPASQAEKFKEPRFDIHADAGQAEAIARKGHRFALDHTVASQLGLAERDRQAAEERILREIERRWEQASEKAEVEGYTKGLEEGKKEAFNAELPRVKEKIEKLDHLLREIDAYRDRIFAANEAFLMDIVAQVASMVALREVSVDQDYVRRLVTTLLHQLGTKEDIKIFLSVQDHANADALFQFLQKEFGKLSNTVIEASEEIPVGGCKIETRFGVVDASVQTQIENVMKSLKA
jgi:flagellar assembly protein FliH